MTEYNCRLDMFVKVEAATRGQCSVAFLIGASLDKSTHNFYFEFSLSLNTKFIDLHNVCGSKKQSKQ